MFNLEKENNVFDSYKIAFHSADPYILKQIKAIDCMIPCGIISMDFSSVEGVDPDFAAMHASAGYFDIFEPDFVSYKVSDLKNRDMKNLCNKRKIPLIGWTVTDEDLRELATDYGCDNYIFEGFN